MSTPGSAPNSVAPGAARYEPPAPAPARVPVTRRRRGIVRWRGLVAVAIVVAALCGGWLTLGETLLRTTIEEAASEFLGTEVDIARLDVGFSDATVEMRGISIADPFDRMRNLVEAATVRAELEKRPLLERKVVVRSLTLGGVRTSTARRTPARAAPRNGFAAATLRSLGDWAAKVRKPIASFTPLYTIRAVALDPARLATVGAVARLGTRADSLRGALDAGYRALALQPVLDSARVVGARLADARPRTLGIAGTRRAAADLRRTIAQIDSAKRRVEALARGARAGAAVLDEGVRALDDARHADYAFARSLMKVPTIGGPELGGALFGDISIDRFQKVLYWARMAEQYVPPGLRPREKPGPKRLRLAGTSVAFPRARDYPDFLLRRGDVDLSVATSELAGAYRLTVTNVTTMPALVREPTRLVLERRAEGGIATMRARGVLDHVGGRLRDSIGVEAAGVVLPSFRVPGLPLRAALGEGTSRLDVVRVGDRLAGRWIVDAPAVAWTRDSSTRARNDVEALALRVIEGVREVQINAEIGGAVNAPSLEVRSNLDRILAARLREVAGEEIARAERKARERVDRIVDEKTAPLRAKADALRAEGERQVAEARARLDEEKRKLEERLRALVAGGGLVPIPGVSR